MRIALLSLNYPPDNNEGIPRQRKMLAEACAAMGHSVHVFTLGPWSTVHREADVLIHRIAVPPALYRAPGVNPRMLESAALFDALQRVHARVDFEIIDAPVWCGLGWAAIERNIIPVVLNLQTTAAQIMAINGQSSPELEEARQLELRCATRAAGILADSQTALESTQNDYGLPVNVPTACVYHGLPDLKTPPVPTAPAAHVEAIVIGRLEKRKGTPDLFQALPAVLKAVPELTIRFVGGDNSKWDGWEQEHGATYANYFKQKHPEYADRVRFEGYVPEERMDRLRAQASFAIVPSLYESFGFTYIEAIRAGLPLVAFANEATRELFPDGEAQGACLVPLQDVAALTDAIIRLARYPATRAQLGEAGRRRYREAFQDRQMAAGSLKLYQTVINDWKKQKASQAACPADIYQVMEGLEAGDGVSHIALALAPLLGALGQPDALLTRHTTIDTSIKTRPYTHVLDGQPHGLLFHYWNYNHSEWFWHHVPGRKALYFHNITPARFFPPDSPQAALCRRGETQLKTWVSQADALVGHSHYTLQTAAQHLDHHIPQCVLYPIVDREELLQQPHDTSLLAQLQQMNAVHWLFVGRIARNKRPDLLMRWFNAYTEMANRPTHLWLVGNDTQDLAYREELAQLQTTLPAGASIHFTGKIHDAALMAYYRAATLFVCASEHEGFGIPLAQAMCFGVPVAARAFAAVPETLGPDGCFIPDTDPETVATYLEPLCADSEKRRELIDAQYTNVQRFSRDAVARPLSALVDFLREGRPLPGGKVSIT